MAATLNLSNQQVNIVTRRGLPTSVTITALDSAGDPFDLTGAMIVAKVTTDAAGPVLDWSSSIDTDEATLAITAEDLDQAIDTHGRANGSLVGRWFVTVEHPELGAEPVPWVDGKFQANPFGSRQTTTVNEIAVSVGATIAVQLGATGPQGPSMAVSSPATTILGEATDEAVTPFSFAGALVYRDVRKFAVADSVTDNDLQAAVDDTPEKGTLIFAGGIYGHGVAPVIDKPMTIEGQGQYTTLLRSIASHGLVIAEGVDNVHLKDIGIAAAVRHTTTPNAFVGVKVEGATGARPTNHVYENIYVDGFQTAVDAEWMWASRLANVRSANGQVGLRVTGLSVNDVVTGCTFVCDQSAGSRGILLDGSATPSEGWIIGDGTVVYGAEIGIEGKAVTHVKVTDCIIDYITNTGILIGPSASNFGGNWDVADNYIAFIGAAGSVGISMTNTIANAQNAGNRVHGNYIITYAGAAMQYAIRAVGAEAKRNLIAGNTCRGATVADIRGLDAANATDVIVDNVCLSAIANNIIGGKVVANNVGTVLYERAVQVANIGKMSVTYDQAAPTNGTWKRGDICFNTTPTAGGTVGWVCVTAGTPGTWKIFGGAIEA